MMQNNNITNNNKIITPNNKKKPGRPKTAVIREPQWIECVNCYKTFDLNLRSLDQAIISDDRFCVSCFRAMMTQEYHDPLDDIIKEFWSGKIRYGGKHDVK